MIVNTLKLTFKELPVGLQQIDKPPEQIFYIGSLETALGQPTVAVVGSRKPTAYGRQVTEQLVSALAKRGVTIISGLAYGIDALAHQTTLANGGRTVAVLPVNLDRIYPVAHNQLADRIVAGGGALMSEYPSGSLTRLHHFIERNRLISGLAQVIVIPEATAKSGSLSTARFGLDQGKTMMAVPGNITSAVSEGCNQLIKSGATPITGVSDILRELNIADGPAGQIVFRGTPAEERIYKLILGGLADQEMLIGQSGLEAAAVNSVLTSLEIGGYIRPDGGGRWSAI